MSLLFPHDPRWDETEGGTSFLAVTPERMAAIEARIAELEAERDSYVVALKELAAVGNSIEHHRNKQANVMADIARDALDGK